MTELEKYKRAFELACDEFARRDRGCPNWENIRQCDTYYSDERYNDGRYPWNCKQCWHDYFMTHAEEKDND